MANIDTSTKAIRDQKLDELDKEVRYWAQEERKRIENEAAFLKRVLRSRAGSARVMADTFETASKLTAQNINQLLGAQAAEEKKA